MKWFDGGSTLPANTDRHFRAAVFLPLLVVVLAVAAGTARAASRPLTLEQALEIADGRNRDIRKAKEYSRQVEGKYVEERSAALPQFTVNGYLSRQQDDSLGAIGGGLYPTRQDTRSVEVAFSQALFTWGKVGAAIRGAEKGFDLAREQLRTARQDTRRDVAIAFHDILLARELHAIAVQNREQKERHLEEAKRRFAAGVATDYDMLAARVAVENARPEVIRTENQIRTTRDRLRFLLAIDDDPEAIGSLAVAPVPPASYDEALATARQRRPELEYLRRKKEIYGELVTIDNAADKPRLDLKGGVGWRQLETGGSHGDGLAWSAGVYLSYPLFDGLKTRGKVAQTRSELRSLEIDEEKLLESVSLEIRTAVNSLNEAEEIVTALSGTVRQAERLLAMAEQGYELGVKIRLEVEDAELNLLQARGNLARARRDLLVARVTRDRVVGTLGEQGDR
jgi:HAE1 family hydrophobic/amphiphilic exporter-1